MRTRLRHSTTILPQSSLTTSLPPPLYWSTRQGWGSKVPPTARENEVWDHLKNLNILKSVEHCEMYPRVPGTGYLITKPLSMIFEKCGSQVTGKGKYCAHLKKGWKEGPWEPSNCQFHYLCAWEDHRTYLPRTSAKAQGGQGSVQDSQHGFTKGKYCLTNLVERVHQWTRKELHMSFIWTFVRPLTRSPSTSFSPNWRQTWWVNNLIDKKFTGQPYSENSGLWIEVWMEISDK